MLPVAFVLLALAEVLAIAFVIGRVLPRPGRISLTVALGAITWGATWIAVAATGILARTDLRPPPFALVLLLTVGAAIGLWRSAAGRALGRAPVGTLIGLQAFRLPLELVMAAAADQGVMPVQMSLRGQNFDVVTGALAVVLWGWSRVRPLPTAAAWIFQVVGVVLLVNIVGIAVASTPMIAAFGTDPAVLNTFVMQPPYVVLPTVLVAAAITLHLCLATRLATRE